MSLTPKMSKQLSKKQIFEEKLLRSVILLYYYYFFFVDYKFDRNGPYYCIVLNYQKNKKKPMSLSPKMS